MSNPPPSHARSSCRDRPRRRRRLRVRPGRRAGLRRRSRHRPPRSWSLAARAVTNTGPVGPQRRSRGLPGHGHQRLPSRASSTGPSTTTTRSPSRRRAISPPPTTWPPVSPWTSGVLTGQDLGNGRSPPGPTGLRGQRSSPGRSPSTRPATPTAVRVHDRLHADDRIGELRDPDQRRLPVQRLQEVGSSATLGSTTAFQGNLMALTCISLDDAATVVAACWPATGGHASTTTSSTAPCAAPPRRRPRRRARPRPRLPPRAARPSRPRRATATINRPATAMLTSCTSGFTASVHGPHD